MDILRIVRQSQKISVAKPFYFGKEHWAWSLSRQPDLDASGTNGPLPAVHSENSSEKAKDIWKKLLGGINVGTSALPEVSRSCDHALCACSSCAAELQDARPLRC